MRFLLQLIFILNLYFFSAISISAQNNFSPPNDAVINVRDFGAVGNGSVDDTGAILLALEYAADNHNGATVYFPMGIYLVSDVLYLEAPKIALYGESRQNTILKLNPNTAGYSDVNVPKPIIHSGFSTNSKFGNIIRNLTINTGIGNPGAVGILIESSNLDGLRDLTILSEDGQGAIGVEFKEDVETSSKFIKNLEVEGFDYGLKAINQSATIEHSAFNNQNITAIYTDGESLSLRNISFSGNPSSNAAIQHLRGFMSVLDTDLSFQNIENEADLFTRNVTSGAILISDEIQQDAVTLDDILEERLYGTNSLSNFCPSKAHSLDLHIEDTPATPYDNNNLWTSVADYGANPSDNLDDSNAFQQALDNGTVIYFSSFANATEYKIDANVISVRPEVRHINLLMNTVKAVGGNEQLLLEGGSITDTLVVEMGEFGLNIVHNDSRVLIIKDIWTGTDTYYQSNPNGLSGNVFIENSTIGTYEFNQQAVWARQLNPGGGSLAESLIQNNNSHLWILGMKTEVQKGLIETKTDGQTEMISGYLLSNVRNDTPLYKATNSELSIVGIKEQLLDSSNTPLETWIFHQNGIDVTEVKKYDLNGYEHIGYNLSGYFGHNNTSGNNEAPQIKFESNFLSGFVGQPIPLQAGIRDDGLPFNNCDLNPIWTYSTSVPNASVQFMNTGNSIKTEQAIFSEPGDYQINLSVDDGALMDMDYVDVHVYEHAVSTATGNGGEAMISSVAPNQNFGGSAAIAALESYISDVAYKIYLRFDISSIVKPISSAQLNLDVKMPSISLPIKGGSLRLYGLKNAVAQQNWVEGNLNGTNATGAEITYNTALNYGNAPGIRDVDGNQTTYLGSFNSTGSEIFRMDQFKSDALVQFLNNDTDGLVTFIIVPNHADFSSYEEIYHASKEDCEHKAPRLLINSATTDPCVGFEISNLCPSHYNNNYFGSAEPVLSGGTAPYTYAWSNGSNNSNGTTFTAGSYTVTITDANGCTATESVTIDDLSHNTCIDNIPENDSYSTNVFSGVGLHLQVLNALHADNAILEGGYARFTAEKDGINIMPDFEVELGAEFCADIAPCDDCPYQDSLALVALYNATNGTNWINTWNLNQPMHTWHGVYVNAYGCVVGLYLDYNNLVGTISPELGSLYSLTNLWLKYNNLSGNIPPELGDLIQLAELDLGNNALSGSIPSEFEQLVSLEYLEMDNNNLSGTIPPELGTLTKLYHLELDDNNLSGSIAPELGNLINLQTLDLAGNNLSGCFPSELSIFCSVSNVNFSFNPLLPGGGDFAAFCSSNAGACN